MNLLPYCVQSLAELVTASCVSRCQNLYIVLEENYINEIGKRINVCTDVVIVEVSAMLQSEQKIFVPLCSFFSARFKRFKLLSFAISLTSVTSSVSADDTIRLFQLTLPCQHCEQVSDDFCRRGRGAEALLLRCDALVLQILEQQVGEKHYSTQPTAREIERALFDTGLPNRAVIPLLQLLVQREQNGDAVLQRLGPHLASRFTLQTVESVAEMKVSDTLFRSLWTASASTLTDGGELLQRALVTARPDIGVPVFLNALAADDTEASRHRLAGAVEFFAGAQRPVPQEMLELQERLSTCAVAKEEVLCWFNSFSGRPASSSETYARRRLALLLPQLAQDSSVPLQRRITLFLHPNINRVTSPQVLASLEFLLRSIRRSLGAEDFASVLNTDTIKSLLLLKAPAIQQEVLGITEAAVDTKNAPLAQNVFLALLESSHALQPEFRLALENVLQREVRAQKRIRGIGFAFVTVALAAVALTLFCFRKNALESSDTAEEMELRSLLHAFALAGTSSLADLRRAYKRQARHFHPDTSGKAPDQFIKLTAQYQRAVDLLTKIKGAR